MTADCRILSHVIGLISVSETVLAFPKGKKNAWGYEGRSEIRTALLLKGGVVSKRFIQQRSAGGYSLIRPCLLAVCVPMGALTPRGPLFCAAPKEKARSDHGHVQRIHMRRLAVGAGRGPRRRHRRPGGRPLRLGQLRRDLCQPGDAPLGGRWRRQVHQSGLLRRQQHPRRRRPCRQSRQGRRHDAAGADRRQHRISRWSIPR